MREGWTYKKLGEVISPAKVIKNGNNNNLPILSITMRDGIVTQNSRFKKVIASVDTSTYKVVKNGQLVIAFPIDEGLIYTQDIVEAGIMSPAYNVWDVDFSNLNRRFLITYLHSPYAMKYYKSKLRGTTMRRRSIPKEDLLNMPLPCPLLSEQQSIVAELDKINELISLKKAQLSDLDNLAQSIFYDMFGDPTTNEKEWEVKTIEDICSSIVRGPFGSALKKEYFVEPDETTYKVYEQKHAIQKDASIGSYYVTKEKFDELSRFEIKANDIIMSCSGTIGELFRIPNSAEKGLMNQALLKFTLNESVNYHFFFFMMEYVKKDFTVRGTGLQNIGSVKIIKEMSFGLPPLPLQQEFAKRIELIEQQKAHISSTIKDLETLLASRMQYWFD